jgi:hypothetical protein
MGRSAGYIWTDHKRYADIAKKLNITTDLDKIRE